MKSFYLCLTLVFILVSCTASSDSEALASKETLESHSIYHKNGDVEPSNSSNPYDVAGQLHNELLEVYSSKDYSPATVTETAKRVMEIANSNSLFMSFGSTYVFNAHERVSYVIANSSSCFPSVLDVSLSNSSARKSLATFSYSLGSLCNEEDDYSVIYEFIVSYESMVLKDITMNEKDKQVILTTTSIARYATYERKKKPKKNKDPEWDYLVTNIIAATDGAVYGIQESVMRSLVVGIAANK